MQETGFIKNIDLKTTHKSKNIANKLKDKINWLLEQSLMLILKIKIITKYGEKV